MRYEVVASTSVMPGSVELAPLSREAKTNCNKAETNDHVPCTDARDWVGSLADVEDHDPEQADKEASDHYWREPRWALEKN